LFTVHWVNSSGLAIAVHQPELNWASRVRNELMSKPKTGTSQMRHRAARKTRTGQVALPGPLPALLWRITCAGSLG